MIAKALYYASLGWPVFPLRPASKRPYRDFLWQDWASFHDNEVNHWWDRYPDANIGVVAKTVMVIDIDPARGGDRSMSDLVRANSKLPKTCVARTGSGGWHYLLSRPHVRHRGKLVEGVDVLNSGCYFVAPPSEHPTGKYYRWVDGRAPWQCGIAECPAWVADLIRIEGTGESTGEGTPRSGSVAAYLGKVPVAVSGQHGHTSAFIAVKKVLSVFPEITDEAVFMGMQDWNSRCVPPWSDKDLMRKIKEARK